MKKLLLIVALITFSSAGLAEPNAEKRMQRLAKKLDLSEEQITQVNAVFESQQATREDIRQQMKALHEDTRNQLSGILTPEQQEKFDQMHQRKKGKRQKHHSRQDG